MNLNDIKMGRKLGEDFFSFFPEIEKSEKQLKDFNSHLANTIIKTMDFEDELLGIKEFNKKIHQYWNNALVAKAKNKLNSKVLSSILIDKMNDNKISEREFKANTLSWLKQKSDEFDVLIMLGCHAHIGTLESVYYLAWFKDLNEKQMSMFNEHLAEKNQDEEEIDTQIVKEFASPGQRAVIASVILEHYQSLFDQACEVFMKTSLFTGIKDSISRYGQWIPTLVTKTGNSLSPGEFAEEMIVDIKSIISKIPVE